MAEEPLFEASALTRCEPRRQPVGSSLVQQPSGLPREVPEQIRDSEPLVLLNTRNGKIKVFPLVLVPLRKTRRTKGRKVLPSGTANELHVVYRSEHLLGWTSNGEDPCLVRISVEGLELSGDLYDKASLLSGPEGELRLDATTPLGTDVVGFLAVAERWQ